MPEKEPKNEPIRNNGPSSYAKFTGLAFQMIAIIGCFTYLGYRMDEANNHQVKWATACMALVGVFISLYVVFKSLKS